MLTRTDKAGSVMSSKYLSMTAGTGESVVI